MVACAGMALVSCATDPAPPTAAENVGVAAPYQRFFVFFEREDAEVSEDAQAIINRAAAEVRASNPQSVIVYGFADARGTATANAKLSQDRAKAVVDGLVRAGVPQSLVVARGMGETATVGPATDLNPEGKRAEIFLVR